MKVRTKKPVLFSVVIITMIVMYRRDDIFTSISDSFQGWKVWYDDLWIDATETTTELETHHTKMRKFYNILGGSDKNERSLPVAPCSFRRMERNHTGLWQKFNFSVPVFQWNQSYSQEEYKRLSRWTSPYGWKDVSEDVIKSTLALLNTSSSTRLVEPQYRDQCLRCAVVGNGGILRGSGQGRDIDSHDLVFRVNAAVTQGYEKDVGTRTSFYGFTIHTVKKALVAYRKHGFARVPQGQGTRYLILPTSSRDYLVTASAIRGQTVPTGDDIGDSPSKYFGRIQHDHFKMLHPDFMYYVSKSLLNSPRLTSRSRNFYRPTTGALVLLAALHTCDQVTAYGYITGNFADFPVHYYESTKSPLLFVQNHDFNVERILWEELDRQSIMRLYKGTPQR